MRNNLPIIDNRGILLTNFPTDYTSAHGFVKISDLRIMLIIHSYPKKNKTNVPALFNLNFVS